MNRNYPNPAADMIAKAVSHLRKQQAAERQAADDAAAKEAQRLLDAKGQIYNDLERSNLCPDLLALWDYVTVERECAWGRARRADLRLAVPGCEVIALSIPKPDEGEHEGKWTVLRPTPFDDPVRFTLYRADDDDYSYGIIEGHSQFLIALARAYELRVEREAKEAEQAARRVEEPAPAPTPEAELASAIRRLVQDEITAGYPY